MKNIILLFFIISVSIFPQGNYLLRENSISVGSNYSRNPNGDKLGFNGIYTFNGIIDFSFSRSVILSEDDDDNFQNEYFFKSYFFKGNLVFISAGVGYITRYVKAELWKDFPLEIESNDFAFEFGAHLSSKIKDDKSFVISFILRQFKPTEFYKTPNASWEETKLTRSIIFDLGFILNFDPVAIEIGPRVNIEIDRGDPFYGLNCNLLLKH